MGLLKNLFGDSKAKSSAKSSAKSNDVLLPIHLINQMTFVGNTVGNADTRWWEEVGLASSFGNFNSELSDALLTGDKKKYYASKVCFSNQDHAEITQKLLKAFKENYPNDTYIVQNGNVNNPDKGSCNVTFAFSITTPEVSLRPGTSSTG